MDLCLLLPCDSFADCSFVASNLGTSVPGVCTRWGGKPKVSDSVMSLKLVLSTIAN